MEAPSNWILKSNSEGSLPLEDCIRSSYITFLKFLTLNPKRVRGYRGGKFSQYGIHYWIESKGSVFDTANNIQMIAPINEYYEKFKICKVEYSSSNGIFEDEVIAIPEDDPKDFRMFKKKIV
jgi:hypothetical protein